MKYHPVWRRSKRQNAEVQFMYWKIVWK